MFGGGFNSLGFNQPVAEGNIIDLSAHMAGQGKMYSRKIETGNDRDQAFNLMSFNTTSPATSVEYVLDFAVHMTLSAQLSGQAQFSTEFIRSFDMEAEPMSGQGRMQAEYIREIEMIAERMSGAGSLHADADRYHTDYIEFTDVFRPGEVIVIDSGKFKITRNGQNVSHLYNGDFFDLNLGNNNLTWTDPETGRTVLFRITHRDKFLY